MPISKKIDVGVVMRRADDTIVRVSLYPEATAIGLKNNLMLKVVKGTLTYYPDIDLCQERKQTV
jgi:hypothetical protein